MVTDDEFQLIEKRLEAWSEKLRIASFGLGEFTKEQVLEHIKAKDEIGSKIAEVQLYYLKKLKERAK